MLRKAGAAGYATWPAGWAACAAIAWGDGLSGLAQLAVCDVCLDLVDKALRDIGCCKVALPGGQHAMGGGADFLQQVFAHPVVQADAREQGRKVSSPICSVVSTHQAAPVHLDACCVNLN